MMTALGREAPGDDGCNLMCTQALYTAVMNALEIASWNGGRIRGLVDNALFKILPCNE